MPLSPQQRRRRTPHATAGNHALANDDQTLTEVDTRLTKVDRGCQKLTASTPAPFRRTPNNPEQIRTNLNVAKRPDQIGPPPESPPNTPKKNKPEHRRRPPATSHSPPSFLRLPPRHSCAPFLVIPAQAGTHLTPTPFPNSSLPPSRGEVRWGVRGCDRPPPLTLPPPHPRPRSVIRAPSRHPCAGRNPGGLQRLVRALISRRPAQAASAPPPDVRRQGARRLPRRFLPTQE